jgi:hypothetical protein
MCDQVRPHAAVGEIYQVEPRCARGKREVSDADKVSVRDAVVMPFLSIERTPKQTGSYLAVDSFCSSESEGSACRSRSKAGKSKFGKKTTGKYQDVEFQCR